MTAIFQVNNRAIFSAISMNHAEQKEIVLPEELALKIFSFLAAADLFACEAVCRDWKRISNETQRLLKDRAFRVINFQYPAEFFGFSIEEAKSALPLNIFAILNSPCPIYSGQTISETHLLAWIPTTIKNGPTTINNIGELIESRFPGRYNDGGLAITGNLTLNGSSRWLLMAQSISEGSELSISRSLEKVDSLSRDTHTTYRIPSTLEAVVVMLTNYLKTGHIIPYKLLTIRLPRDDNYSIISVSQFRAADEPPNNPIFSFGGGRNGAHGWLSLAPIRTI